MRFPKNYGLRVLLALIPMVLALLHASGIFRIAVLQHLDDAIYDTRLRATMPRTLDPRIVIVDIDERSVTEVGQWPWGRDRLADLTQRLFADQQVRLLAFDMVFSEPDESSGLKRMRQLAQNELKEDAAFLSHMEALAPTLDFDARFAKAMADRPVVLGFFFNNARAGQASGRLPAPVIPAAAMAQGKDAGPSWLGYGANIERLARAAPAAGFFNAVAGADGVVRSLPLFAKYQGAYFESLTVAMLRQLLGDAKVFAGFAGDGSGRPLHMTLSGSAGTAVLSFDERLAAPIPFRGPGGAKGGSFEYLSATDILHGRVTAGRLKDKIVLVGTSADGLQNALVTPVGEAFPGVEVHANVLSAMLDDRLLQVPEDPATLEVLLLLMVGVLLALTLPALSALKAVLFSALVAVALAWGNYWAYVNLALVFPIASALVMTAFAYAIHMSYGYLVESRSKRELATLFGSYVPPQLVHEMVKDPASYTMVARSLELTVLFSDMRGFTKLSENMPPLELQHLLNDLFSRLTTEIQRHQGTIDKYMGDCVMAFWGAPIDTPDHAKLAVRTALRMVDVLGRMNEEHRAKGLPEVGVGVGINTGWMCVGDMGSDIRLAYTVIGDEVNLGSRVEGLTRHYGVDIIATGATVAQAQDWVWQELDKVRVKGKDEAITIYTPRAAAGSMTEGLQSELDQWREFLLQYRAQRWMDASAALERLTQQNANNSLYTVYRERLAFLSTRELTPDWDGVAQFDHK